MSLQRNFRKDNIPNSWICSDLDVVHEYNEDPLCNFSFTFNGYKALLELLSKVDVHGISHITGGGFDENIPRILKPGQAVEIKEGSWEILPVFKALETWGKIPHREMFNVFNMGIGLVMALDGKDAAKAVEILASHSLKATVIGKVVERAHAPANGSEVTDGASGVFIDML